MAALVVGVFGVAARPSRESPWPSGGVVITTSGWEWKVAKILDRNVFGE